MEGVLSCVLRTALWERTYEETLDAILKMPRPTSGSKRECRAARQDPRRSRRGVFTSGLEHRAAHANPEPNLTIVENILGLIPGRYSATRRPEIVILNEVKNLVALKKT